MQEPVKAAFARSTGEQSDSMRRGPDGAASTRVVFCGDRRVGAQLVRFMREGGAKIVGVGLNVPPFATHASEILETIAPDDPPVFYAGALNSELAIRKLARARPDLGVCCGFASILSKELLELPRWGWVNLHRSYLPYNRGLDPLQWAVIDGTPAGVTLHVMTGEVDAGPIVAQVQIPVGPMDDFEALSGRADAAVFRLFRSCWPMLRSGPVPGVPQDEDLASYHSWSDCEGLRRLDLDAAMPVRRVLDILRVYSGGGLTAAHVERGGIRYFVHAELSPSPVLARAEVPPEGLGESAEPAVDIPSNLAEANQGDRS